LKVGKEEMSDSNNAALTVLNNGGGIGFNTGSRLTRLKPANVELVQNMTKQEGAIPGKFRITATNQHLDSLHVVLLDEPGEQRAYFEGGKFTKEARLCYSMDSLKPSDNAQVPQAMVCATCPKQSWARWNQAKQRGEKDLQKYKPECDRYWHLILVDRVLKAPYYFNVRKTAVKHFEKAMQGMAYMAATLKSQGHNPNIFDFSFKILAKKEQGQSYYVPVFTDFAFMGEEDRKEFTGIFLAYQTAKAAAKAASQSTEPEDAEFSEPPAQGATTATPGNVKEI
jgi:hypothetical protein